MADFRSEFITPAGLSRFMNSIGAEFAGELFGTHQINPPQLLKPPWRHRRRIHRADICVCQKCEPEEILLSSHTRAERARRRRVFHVTAAHDHRKIEMMLNEKQNLLLNVLRSMHARENGAAA